MRILFICHRLPYPPNRGGKIRPFNMIRHLSRQHSVVVASLAESEKELAEGADLSQHCSEVIAEVIPKWTRWRQAWKALFTRTPSSAAYFWSKRLDKRIQSAAARKSFDLVWVHCAFVACYAASVKQAFKVLDYGDLDSLKWSDYSQWKSWPLSWGYALEAIKLRNYEKDLTNRFDYFTVTATGELEAFKKLSASSPCALIPNGVDSSFFRGGSNGAAHRHTIVFVGRMDYFPNIDGILYFMKSIFPIVRRHIPAAELQIVGSDPVHAVRDLGAIAGV